MDAGRVSIDRDKGTLIARVRERLLIDTASIVREQLPDLADVHVQLLVADLRDVKDIDSSGLAVLLWMHRTQALRGCSFMVLADTPQVLRAFEVTGLDDVFDVRAEMPS